jgi:CBS domain-containing protein
MKQRKISLKRSEDYYIKALLKEVKIKEIMTTPVVSINVESSFAEVPKLLERHGVRHLPVVGGKNRLAGLISQRDVYRLQPPHTTLDGDLVYDEAGLRGIILKHVMKNDPFFMYEDDCMGDALVKFVEHKYGCIPIVNRDHELQGLVTQEDILRIAAQIYLE